MDVYNIVEFGWIVGGCVYQDGKVFEKILENCKIGCLYYDLLACVNP